MSGNNIKAFFDSIPGVKKDWKEDFKEDAKTDWKADWTTSNSPTVGTLLFADTFDGVDGPLAGRALSMPLIGAVEVWLLGDDGFDGNDDPLFTINGQATTVEPFIGMPATAQLSIPSAINLSTAILKIDLTQTDLLAPVAVGALIINFSSGNRVGGFFMNVLDGGAQLHLAKFKKDSDEQSENPEDIIVVEILDSPIFSSELEIVKSDGNITFTGFGRTVSLPCIDVGLIESIRIIGSEFIAFDNFAVYSIS